MTPAGRDAHHDILLKIHPYGSSFVSGQGDRPDQTALDGAVHQGKRVAEIAAALKRGLEAA